MKLLALLLSLTLMHPCFAQLKVANLGKNAIPKNVQYKGNLVHAVRWADSIGDNMVVLSATDKTKSKNAPDDSYSDAALYAYHYLVSGDISKQTWTVYDYVKQCPLDLSLYFVDKAFAVTDLNRDGKAEVWIMYKNSCQGDVSPVPMKIIMYQDDKKFAVRGTTKVQVSAKEYAGGEYSFNDAFKRGPSVFREYAAKLWTQHKVEKWDR